MNDGQLKRSKKKSKLVTDEALSSLTPPPLRQGYEVNKRLYEAQPPLVLRFIESQARQLTEDILNDRSRSRFLLPDRVVVDLSTENPSLSAVIPSELREQTIGSFIDRLAKSDLREAVRNRLAELEGSNNPAIATSSQLIRYSSALIMIHQLLPSGRSVKYAAPEGEQIPCIPIREEGTLESAITATTDAIVEEGNQELERGNLQTPFVPDARRFFLPQWVAFDSKGSLLVNSEAEAEAYIGSMQRFLDVLHAAISLAPYFVADPEYQKKRYGMLGQLVNQGRALASYQVKEIVRLIQKRAAANDLNRGLSLNLPFFDDQTLKMQTHDFTVIPSGRIMFVPAFVIKAAYEEQAKVAQDTRLSPSTRKYLLLELKSLAEAFKDKSDK